MSLLTEEEVIKSILHVRPGGSSRRCDELYDEIRSRLILVSNCLSSLRTLSNRRFCFNWEHKMVRQILTVICTLAYIKHLLQSFYSSKREEEGATISSFSKMMFGGSADKAKFVRPDVMRLQCQELEKELWTQLEEIAARHRNKGWTSRTYDLDTYISIALEMRQDLESEGQGVQLLRTVVQVLDVYLRSLQAEAARSSFLDRILLALPISHVELVLETVRSSFPAIMSEIPKITVDVVPPMTAEDFFSLCCCGFLKHIGRFF